MVVTTAFLKLKLIYNVVLVTAVQQIYIYIYFFFHYDLSWDTEYSSLCYTAGPCLSFQKLTFANHRLVQCLERLTAGGGGDETCLKIMYY